MAIVALALPSAASAAPKKKPRAKPCPSAGIARSLQAVLYIRSSGDDYTIYGCYRKTRKRTAVGGWFSCECSIADETQPDTWLTGRQVAVHDHGCSPIEAMNCFGRLTTIDLRSRKVRHRINTGGSLGDLLLKANGSLAYLSGGALTKVDTTGSTVVDPGPGVDPGSIAANRGRLYWSNGGVARFAPFH